MSRVVEVADVDSPNANADDRDDFGQLLAELVQLLLQRSLVLLGSSHLLANFANLRVHASANHHAATFARRDVSALRRETSETEVKEQWKLRSPVKQ